MVHEMIKNAQARTISLSKRVFIVVLGEKIRSMAKTIAADSPEIDKLAFILSSMLEEIITNRNKNL
ncbi:hypothetical protein SDC9_183374 [bioreactor metagenome]|uniref:Uncharacterized protein n=1 Tax=bioreactor metagenome TaxID=1076179 RepID=A0A645HBX9_9ZZZZ